MHRFPKPQNPHDLYGGSAFRNPDSCCRNRSARHASREAFAKPLCTGNGPCYASVNTNANAADNAHSLCNSMACMRSAIEGKLCAQRCLSGNGAAFIDENGNGICDKYENGLCPGNGLGYGNGNGLGNGSGTQNGNTYGYGSGNGYGACANGSGCGYAQGHGHGACNGFVDGHQRA